MLTITDFRRIATVVCYLSVIFLAHLPIFFQADHQLSQQRLPTKFLRDAASDLVTKYIQKCQDGPREQAAFHIVNNIFHICAHINNTQITRAVLAKIDGASSHFPNPSRFPLPEQVTYHFYAGRFNLLESKFTTAERHLDFAYQHCPESASQTTFIPHKNKRLILLYLIPVRMLHFVLPSTELLRKYQMVWFEKIRLALVTGFYLHTIISSFSFTYLLSRKCSVVNG